MNNRAEHAPSINTRNLVPRNRFDGVAITANTGESKHCAWCNGKTPWIFSVHDPAAQRLILRYRKCGLCLDDREKDAIRILFGVLSDAK